MSISQYKWFHALRFPDGSATPGRFAPSIPPNYSLYGPLAFLPHLDLAGRDCLDLGTMDGLMGFAMASRGGRVVATDVSPRPSFEFAREKLGLHLEYRVPMVIAELSSQQARYDFIACCGILYHVFDPLPSLITLRQSLREGGILVLESQYQWARSGSQIMFCPSQPGSTTHANTFFRPSFDALLGMVQVAGFQPLATIGVIDRLTVLASAEKPSRIKTRWPMVREVLDRYRRYANYREAVDYDALETAAEQTAMAYTGPLGDYVMASSDYRPAHAFEPEWQAGWPARMRDTATIAIARAVRKRWISRWPG